MTTFNDRERAFEEKYARDEALQFKVNARRNKLLGLWAAAKLGKSGAEAEAYAKEVVISDFEAPGHEDVLHKVAKDFKEAGLDISREVICAESERLLKEARHQLMNEG